MHAGTRRGGDRRRNVGAVTRSPIPSRTFPGLLTRIYPAFYQGTPPHPSSSGRIANQPLRCAWNLPSLLTPGVAVRLPKRAFDLRDVVRMNQVEDAGAGELLGLPADHALQRRARVADHPPAS